jgi:hypothetical protein
MVLPPIAIFLASPQPLLTLKNVVGMLPIASTRPPLVSLSSPLFCIIFVVVSNPFRTVNGFSANNFYGMEQGGSVGEALTLVGDAKFSDQFFVSLTECPAKYVPPPLLFISSIFQ